MFVCGFTPISTSFLVISRQSVHLTGFPVTTNISGTDRLLILHDFWISSETHLTISLNVRNHRHGDIKPRPRIEPATPEFQIQRFAMEIIGVTFPHTNWFVQHPKTDIIKKFEGISMFFLIPSEILDELTTNIIRKCNVENVAANLTWCHIATQDTNKSVF